MVEIEQEELERLKEVETKYNALNEEHSALQTAHATLKDDYIEICKSQRQFSDNKGDEFDEYCKSKFVKK